MAVSQTKLDQGRAILERGGYLSYRLETDRYTGRLQRVSRLCDAAGQPVKGFGFAAVQALKPGLKSVSSRSSDWPTLWYLEPVAPRVKAAISEHSRAGYAQEWQDYS